MLATSPPPENILPTADAETARSTPRAGFGSPTAALAAAVALAGCVVVPRTTTVYDEQCQRHARHMTLEVQVLATIGHCRGDECVAMLVSAGVITAATAVVSGSVAIVGNIAYWIEHQGHCARPLSWPAGPAPDPAAAPASPGPPAAPPPPPAPRG